MGFVFVVLIVVGVIIYLIIKKSNGGKLSGSDLCQLCRDIRFGPENNKSKMDEAIEVGNSGNNLAAKIMYSTLLPHLQKSGCMRCVNKMKKAIESL